jgi:hypothetical protein
LRHENRDARTSDLAVKRRNGQTTAASFEFAWLNVDVWLNAEDWLQAEALAKNRSNLAALT